MGKTKSKEEHENCLPAENKITYRLLTFWNSELFH